MNRGDDAEGLLATAYDARGPDLLEEGRLGGMSWGMGRGAAPPLPRCLTARPATLPSAAIAAWPMLMPAVVRRHAGVHEHPQALRRETALDHVGEVGVLEDATGEGDRVDAARPPRVSASDPDRGAPMASWNPAASSATSVPARRSATSQATSAPGSRTRPSSLSSTVTRSARSARSGRSPGAARRADHSSSMAAWAS